jgi:hypothetical protein
MRNVFATTFAAAVVSLFAAAACANSEDIGGDTSSTDPASQDGGAPMGDPPTRTDPSGNGNGGNSGNTATDSGTSNTKDAGSGSSTADSGSGTGTDSGGTGVDSGSGSTSGGPACDTTSVSKQLKDSAFYGLYAPVLGDCPCDPSMGFCCYDDGKDAPKCIPDSL